MATSRDILNRNRCFRHWARRFYHGKPVTFTKDPKGRDIAATCGGMTIGWADDECAAAVATGNPQLAMACLVNAALR